MPPARPRGTRPPEALLGRSGYAAELVASLIPARSLEEVGEHDRALSLYEDVGQRLAGPEAQCRQATLLIRLGRLDDALRPLEEAERRARRIDRLERTREPAMYDWAARALAELRTDPR